MGREHQQSGRHDEKQTYPRPREKMSREGRNWYGAGNAEQSKVEQGGGADQHSQSNDVHDLDNRIKPQPLTHGRR
jgi:hypothetical protein